MYDAFIYLVVVWGAIIGLCINHTHLREDNFRNWMIALFALGLMGMLYTLIGSS